VLEKSLPYHHLIKTWTLAFVAEESLVKVGLKIDSTLLQEELNSNLKSFEL